MANITYRVNSNPAIPGTSIVKGTPLTNVEVDANFRAIDIEVDQLNSSTVRLTGDQTIGGVKTFTGNVGIGTNSPGYRLDASAEGPVGAVVDIARFFAAASATAEARILFGTAANVVNAGIGAVTTSASDSELKFYTEGSGTLAERLRIDNSGNVTATGNITAGGQFIGNAATATNISNTGTVTLASATEANAITITAPSYTPGMPVKLLNFDWYGNLFSMGNIRSASLPSNGFGIYYTASGGSRTEIARFGTGGSFNAVGNITAGGNVLVTGNTSGLGYGTGAGGTVTQATSKSTPVTLNRPVGDIVMHAALLAGGASVLFDLLNSVIAADDLLLVLTSRFGGTYRPECVNVFAGGATIRVTNVSGSSLSEAPTIRFAVIKGATS